ncbi:MAG: cbb3-type cytochrome c oxidase subunit 3 [Proteobacteria bacterium]|nr:cbb3-type cytochrome c oxidase subunit 3 [Pseudomonadota bacterium]
MDHDDLVAFSQSWGMIYLLVFFVGAVVYAFWPGNRARFRREAHRPLEEDDRPWNQNATK